MASDGAAQPGLLRSARVAIVGLGLIGGSLALALRGRCAALYGIDPNPAVLDLAEARDLCDRLSASAADLLPAADVVILAAPVRTILKLIRDLPELHPGRAIVLDVGSTKTAIFQALSGLPERFDPLGGHPMGGKEKGGLASAEPGIFTGVTFAFTPLPQTSEAARAFAAELAAAIGAHPLWLDPTTHDSWTAYTSHLAYLVSTGMVLASPPVSAALAGPGFRSATRLAASDPGIMLDILETNRSNVRSALARFRKQIDRLDAALAAEDLSSLKRLLEAAVAQREQMLAAQAAKESPQP
jgi:prephenate dehydrogenase